MAAMAGAVQVACAGCGLTRQVPAGKLTRCDGYVCGVGGCDHNPAFQLPPVPAGHVCVVEVEAAGDFSGWRTHALTPALAAGLGRLLRAADGGGRP